MKFDVNQIEFKPLEETHLQLVHKWLSDPYISNIWSPAQSITLEKVHDKYLPRIRGEVPVHCYLTVYGTMPIGLVQWYLWKDFKGDAKYIKNEELDATGFDIFIGESDFRSRGLGQELIRKFLAILFSEFVKVDSCIITPHADNEIAIRAYEKAGFRKVRIELDPMEPWSPIIIMQCLKKGA